MKLKIRFLLLMIAIFVGFMLITWLLSVQLMNKLNERWSDQFIKRQVMLDKYRTLAPLIREIALARQMAAEPAIIDMALHEHDVGMRQRGIEAMEKYRFNFRDHSYFAAFAQSGNYYYNDATNQFAGKQKRYVLSPASPQDKWFYATLSDSKEYQVNIDPDVHLKVTKAWINVLIRSGNQVLGVIGTGIELTDLIKETVSATQSGGSNLFIDKSMAIQLNSDTKLIDYMSIAKDVGQRIKVDVLLKNPEDVDRLRLIMLALERSPADNATMTVEYLGREHLLGVAYLPELGWYDLTLMDAPHLNLLSDLFMAPILFGAALLLALIAVGWALRRWILNPIEALRISTDRMGQGDFEVMPAVKGAGEIAHLADSFEQMARFVMDSNRKLEEKVKARTEELHRLTEIDPMTGLLNRRGMMERFESEIARQSRQGGTLGLLLLDLDHFKRINDSFGHSAGDLALCEAAKVLLTTKRAYDHAARWGGEEFLVLLPDCSEQDLLAIAERIRIGISGLEIQAAGQAFSFTVSVGAHHPRSPQTIDAMLQKVDSALYEAKGAGRNCVRMTQNSTSY